MKERIIREVQVKSDLKKTKAQLIAELEEMRERMAELEVSEAEHRQLEVLLKESEEKYRILTEDSPIGIYFTDFTGTFLYGNNKAEEMVGYRRDKLIGKSFLKLKLLEQKGIARAVKLLALNKLGKGTGPDDFLLNRKDGSQRTVQIHTKVVSIDGKKVVLGMVEDVTEHKRLEEKQRQLSEYLKSVLDSLSDPLYVIGADDYSIRMANKAAKTHYPDGKPFCYQNMHGRDKPCEEDGPCVIAEIKRTGSPVVINRRVYDKEGNPISIDVHAHPIYDADGNVSEVVDYAIDVTERKRMEEALRESEERYRRLFKEAPVGIVLASLDGQIIDTNKSMADIVGYTLEEYKKANVTDSYRDPADRHEVLEILDRDGRVVNHPIKLKRRDGTPFEALTNLVRVHLEGKDVLQGIVIDITERRRMEEQLRESEERIRALFEQAPESIVLFNMENGAIVEFNEMAYQNLGYSHEEFSQLTVTDIGTLESADEIAERSRNIMKEGGDAFETKHRMKSGELRDVLVSSRPISIGGKTYIQSIQRDITERRWMEEQLRESEEKLRAIFEQAAESLVLVDADNWAIVEFNERAYQSLGYSHQEYSKLTLADIEANESAEEIDAHLTQVLREGGDSFQTRHRMKGGDMRDILVSTKTISIRGKDYVQCIFRDITDSKRTEVALRESEEMHRNLVNLAGKVDEAIIMLRDTEKGDAIHVFVGDCWPRITGYSNRELLGMSFFDLLHSRYHQASRRRHRRKMGGEVLPGLFEMHIIRKDGSEVPIEVASASTIFQGAPVNVAFIRDITERKQAEQELQKYERLESVGTLAGGIAHDFNNLLTGIMGNISLAQRYIEPGGKAFQRLEEAERASLRARDLTQQLLTFSRGGAPIKKVVSVGSIVEDAATFSLRGSSIRCQLSLPDDLWLADVDTSQISQVITNIVMNADEAMPDRGTIKIEARNRCIKKNDDLPLPNGDYLEITIEDQGVGIARKNLTRIFDPYFTTKQKGSGLGLATAYSIVKSHGGHITVRSKLGDGTIFHIFLPASMKPVPLEEENHVEVLVSARGRVLVMDDEEAIRDLLSQILKEIGYQVVLAKEGTEAVELFSRAKESGQPFDVVILDLTIRGGMGGQETVRNLLEIAPDIKAIASSGYSTDPVMAEYKKYGFSGVAVKPYRIRELRDTLRNVMSAGSG